MRIRRLVGWLLNCADGRLIVKLFSLNDFQYYQPRGSCGEAFLERCTINHNLIYIYFYERLKFNISCLRCIQYIDQLYFITNTFKKSQGSKNDHNHHLEHPAPLPLRGEIFFRVILETYKNVQLYVTWPTITHPLITTHHIASCSIKLCIFMCSQHYSFFSHPVLVGTHAWVPIQSCHNQFFWYNLLKCDLKYIRTFTTREV